MGVVEVLDPVRPAKTVGYKVDVSRGERNGRLPAPLAAINLQYGL